MTDVLMKELWKIKDDIAKEHAFNVDSLADYLRAKDRENAQFALNHHSKQDKNTAALNPSRVSALE